MQRNGYRESTIRSCIKSLKAQAKRSNLFQPEEVKLYLAHAKLSENRKQTLVEHVDRFYRWKKIIWTRPRYRRIETLPFIPLETEIDQLISANGSKWAIFLQLLKETGCRPGEGWALRWIDIDKQASTVTIAPEKNSRPRQCIVSSRLIAMLDSQPKKHILVFHDPNHDSLKSLDDFRRTYINRRNQAADKLQNPRLRQITFRTLRHFKATMEYNRTKDILHVMQILGHRNIKNTLVYTHLVNFKSDEYVCKAASNVDQARELIETGFEYVTECAEIKLFRKRK
jgi:integrase